MSNVDGNNNKFWKAEMDSSFTVHVTNGRVGSKGQTQSPKPFGSEDAAMRFMSTKRREKERKGYKELDVVESTGSTKVNQHKLVEKAAKEQIRTKGDRSEVEGIIDKLIALNIHSITSQTDITYDAETGVFMTPMGIVSLDSIHKARSLLDIVADHVVDKKDFTSSEVKQSLADYLMLIPQKVGARLTVKNVIPDQEAVHKQNAILDDLEASLAHVEDLKKAKAEQAKKAEKEMEIPELFNCELTLLDNPEVEAFIKGIYNNTRKGYHASAALEVNRIFTVQVDEMHNNFEKVGRQTDNVMMLWHGTRAGNILSILKNGLIIPPSRAGHVTGRMFGDGLYFSDQSTKSLNYSYGYWDGGSKDDTCYMFLCEVAMGNSYIPQNSWENLPKRGYDSTFAVAGKSGVINNEMIVYDVCQSNIRYLIEFKQKR
ncbi:WGR domain-containing protein [Vibrio harveyi]|uniref:WGR domain-containing protein n=1 Tax=Vibrio harveyi TaxID=669 RepID=UPI003CEA8427